MNFENPLFHFLVLLKLFGFKHYHFLKKAMYLHLGDLDLESRLELDLDLGLAGASGGVGRGTLDSSFGVLEMFLIIHITKDLPSFSYFQI